MASIPSMKLIPSTSLLLAIPRPSNSPFCTNHLRHSSNGTFQSKPKPNRLDKLHRKQRADLRAEKQASLDRAAAMPLSETNSASIPQETSEIPTESAIPPQTPVNLPYAITRTPSAQLPVYHLAKAGGNKHITQMRKLSGDLHRLKEDVFKVLGFKKEYDLDLKGRKKENVVINWTTGQIAVRGWRGLEIKRWAEGVGF